ncbi:MAG: aminotransferase class I/II-fold pyridoxal phosphate-dependent enzyme [Betaproteobacteria bacterium]|nr:aminotransferase class I/II-fold pyridoxal phosphate-dependent enzyme [Betaproteobacteria bacterium]
MDLQSLVIHGDAAAHDDSGVAPAIHPSSTFRARGAEEFADMVSVPRHARYYARYGNPTVQRAEMLLAQLEAAPAALLLASGMGAVSTTVLAHVRQGDHVVAQSSHYMGTTRLLTDLLARWGVAVSRVDQTDTGAFAAAVRPNTRLILVETPSNPTLAITDLAGVAALARERDITTVADNTFATPVNCRPRDFGIDLVVHSATKYLGGHSDLVAGVVCGEEAAVERIWQDSIVLGACSNAWDAFLLLRGLRTLPLRVERAGATALALARFLEGHPAVARVYYPGLESHPGHALARAQMRGFGGVLAFEPKGGHRAAQQCVSRLQLAANAVSLGGVETLAVHVGSVWEGSLVPEQIEQAGVSPGLVRVAVGLEAAADLVEDFGRALET